MAYKIVPRACGAYAQCLVAKIVYVLSRDCFVVPPRNDASKKRNDARVGDYANRPVILSASEESWR